MVLPCSRTLVDVSYPFTIQTTETFFLNDYDVNPDEDTHLVQGDSIDLLPIVKELVLLEIPMQVIAEQPAEGGAPQAGVGWEVITEEQLKEKIDPRLAGLAKFFEQKEE